jgi:transposase
MYYLGVDYHKEFSYCTMMNGNGNVVKQGRMENSSEGVKNFIDGADNKIIGVMEATRNWTLMYDWLEERIEGVKLAHPLKVKAIAEAKVKTDKIDSTTLAHLLRCDLLPESYVPSKEARYIRQVLRQRIFFVRIQTMLKNRIRGIIDKHPEVGKPPAENIFGIAGMAWLKEIKIAEIDKKIIGSDIELLNSVRERISTSDKLIEELGKADERVKYLMSIPGIGQFFAVLLCYEIDDINRFRDDKKLHAYAGLVPSTYASGNRVVHGHITKQGNKWIRWAMVEAVWPAIRKDSELRTYYERLKIKKSHNCAKVATAKRLLTIVYRILKEKRYSRVHGGPDKTLTVCSM